MCFLICIRPTWWILGERNQILLADSLPHFMIHKRRTNLVTQQRHQDTVLIRSTYASFGSATGAMANAKISGIRSAIERKWVGLCCSALVNIEWKDGSALVSYLTLYMARNCNILRKILKKITLLYFVST